jgi:hypothetical protein
MLQENASVVAYESNVVSLPLPAFSSETTKCCAKCNEQKPVSEFHADKSRKSGVRATCRDCVSKRDRERIHTVDRQYSESMSSAKRRGIGWHIDKPYIKGLWDIASNCPCCGRPFESHNSSKYVRNPAKKSIDRRDSAFDYLRGNVQIICHQCNQAKNEFSQEDFERHSVDVAATLLPHMADRIRNAYEERLAAIERYKRKLN